MSWTTPQVATTAGQASSAGPLSYGTVGTGDLLVAIVATFSVSTTVSSITDTLGNTYTQAGSYAQGASSNRISVWYAISKASGSNSVSLSFSGSDYFTLGLLDYAAPGGTISLYTTVSDNSSNHGGANATPTCGSIGVAGAGSLLLAAYCQGSTTEASCTAGTGFTLRNNQLNGSSYEGMGSEDALNVSAAQTGSFTLASAVSWTAIGVSFQATGGGGASAGPLRNLVYSFADPTPEDLE